MEDRRFQAGQAIYRAGDPPSGVHIIRSGKVALLLEQDGQTIRLDVLGQNQLFGEMSVIEDRPHSVTALAETDVTAVFIDAERFRKAFDPKNSIALTLLKALSQRLRQANEVICRLTAGQNVDPDEAPVAALDAEVVAQAAAAVAAAAQPKAAAAPEAPAPRRAPEPPPPPPPVAAMLLIPNTKVAEKAMGAPRMPLKRFPFLVGMNDTTEFEGAVVKPDMLLFPYERKSVLEPKHFEIDLKDGRAVVRDLGTRHGTLVNGKMILSPDGGGELPLNHGANNIVAGPTESLFRFIVMVK